jgi:hypothetical protein
MSDDPTKQKPLSQILREAGKKALGGGIPGALAMVIQVLALMWMRTTINYQHSKGLSTLDAMSALYAAGGVARFYQGIWAALLQAPLSRFGDTAANAGMLALLETITWLPISAKTFCASCAAALFRIFITPIDALKTTLQVQGSRGMSVLAARVAAEGPLALYSGALGSSFATLMGHYPWFIVYNFLQARVPQKVGVMKMLRSAGIGFCASFCSDLISNSVRVIKTAKQTADVDLGYMGTAADIIASDGVSGLMLRGLGTKIISNGVQAMLFTVCWRYLEEKMAERARKAKAA